MQAYGDADAGASLLSYAYWQSAFAPVEKSDELLTDLMPLDPGRFPHPHLDRFLHFHQAIKDVEQRSPSLRIKQTWLHSVFKMSMSGWQPSSGACISRARNLAQETQDIALCLRFLEYVGRRCSRISMRRILLIC